MNFPAHLMTVLTPDYRYIAEKFFDYYINDGDFFKTRTAEDLCTILKHLKLSLKQFSLIIEKMQQQNVDPRKFQTVVNNMLDSSSGAEKIFKIILFKFKSATFFVSSLFSNFLTDYRSKTENERIILRAWYSIIFTFYAVIIMLIYAIYKIETLPIIRQPDFFYINTQNT